MKRFLLVLCSIVFFAGGAAFAADLVSTWQSDEGGTLTLSVRDAAHVRLDTAPDNYMLMTGEKVYMVAKDDGQWTVMDMDQMAGMMKMFGGGGVQAPDGGKVTYKKTGRTETIAGYKGTVYIGETRDAAGKVTDSAEVVFSKAQDIVRINEAWMAMAAGMGRIAGPELSRQLEDAADQARAAGYGGFLRVDKDLKLLSVKKERLPAGHFSLPDGAAMNEMPSVPPRKPAAATSAPAAGGGDAAGSAAADAATSVGKEIGGAAADEAKSATMDEVREEVRGFFNKIFNND